ncbi:MAG: hypothetical protein N2201_05155, partial [candidate division WOR-3 bacterium]|nr:hypothetical protein [candidate division WOR-3 bacterium]
VANDANAIQFNPAGLSQVNNLSVMSFYKLPFGGLGINLHHFSISAVSRLRKAPGTLGFAIQEIGIPMHSERILTLSYGMELVKDIAFGYNMRGYQLYQKDFGSGFTFGLDIGVLSRIYKRWQVGFYVHNLNKPKLGEIEKSELPQLLNFGVAYLPTYGITSAFDISKEPGKPTRIMAGQEFEIIENYLTLRAGLQTEPIRFAFGLRTGIKNIFVDYALTTHPELPLTHNFGLQYSF